MPTLIKESYPIAKKEYRCIACSFLMKAWEKDDVAENCTEEEIESVKAAIRDEYKIKPGQKYLYQFIRDCEDVFSFRGRIDIDEICRKYNLYPEY